MSTEEERAHLAKVAERIVNDILELAHMIDNEGWNLAYAMAIRSDRHLSYARAVKTVGQLANLRVF